ncbi:MAG: hypothetical protein SPI06_05315 [Terrisporobacter sp.]|uniref:hypothetical protein n=1 Tax=Terrisporobacter sp. TaxID=1965305 RepID=UPI002A912FF3|nr:hypothetical protein [Terrisporobacter sp.]MDY6152813.1 hypothetical protein [Terrisporobacter sp.]
MALRIKDSVDLKDLEKYGYALNYWTWCEETGVYQKRLNHYNDYVYIDTTNRIIDRDTPFGVIDADENDVPDLIKADLVVKVEK